MTFFKSRDKVIFSIFSLINIIDFSEKINPGKQINWEKMANTLYYIHQHTQLSTIKMNIFTLEYEAMS